MDNLKGHLGGNANVEKSPEQNIIKAPENLFVCSAHFFALLMARNAAIVYHHLKVFKNADGSLPTVLKINNQVLFAFKHYTLKMLNDEARSSYNKFVDSLIDGEHIYLQFDTSQEWIAAQVKTYMEVIDEVNDGKSPLEAVDIVNQNHLESKIKQASEKIRAEGDKKKFSSATE
ncbi:MAG: hypothetical protein EOP53_16055 [Sphingobacteriales bacterium]|nr:MAG: hypothetical protein EOP53_16055 [Sphingobacteriales bacterium]